MVQWNAVFKSCMIVLFVIIKLVFDVSQSFDSLASKIVKNEVLGCSYDLYFIKGDVFYHLMHDRLE